MINIKLIDNWRLKSDKNQYILVKEQNDREIIEGYFSEIETAVQCMVDMKIRSFDSTSIFSLIQNIKSLQTSLNKALQPLKLEVRRLDNNKDV